jgi:hypothetical protein
MKDCRTFLKLQKAVGHKQAEARRQGYNGNASNVPPANQQVTNGAAQRQNQPSQGNKNDGGYIPSKGHISSNDTTSIKVKQRAKKHLSTS